MAAKRQRTREEATRIRLTGKSKHEKGVLSHSNLLFMLALVSTEGLFAYATEMLMH